MKKVTGIGGVFFKCRDANEMKKWYKTHLGLDTDQYGTTFEWRQSDDPIRKQIKLWEPNDIEYDKIVGGRTK